MIHLKLEKCWRVIVSEKKSIDKHCLFNVHRGDNYYLGIVPNITFYILLLKTKTVVTTPVTTSDMASDSLKSFKRSLKYFCEYFLKIFLPGQFSRFLRQILIFNKAAILAFEAQQSHHLKYQYDIIQRCYIGLKILRKIP